jgi:hypothetical protein
MYMYIHTHTHGSVFPLSPTVLAVFDAACGFFGASPPSRNGSAQSADELKRPSAVAPHQRTQTDNELRLSAAE